ncbi:hypothetical protein EMIHUDRAFT_117124 [Emiliania huxleyi CCMP1516]|uniref:MYND-type domain-containing protein n=2 Tax=Emiliania huxleyi TaxID=2903 RepID=A0A0D3JDA7_EMIH1|nr:hypothetical protein EMIHUDRAFT_117124 [Emiliania huxleyi CCMP1516]EOD21492.1 hypothetical protein EMIHUDRAFT_117124 [Emiliania huxleyi CCMP1516]|eukprot:XP_005773921.1 hypothetical protein EMIHUDRAFT_117124 [Emiliania huxleyi CCMP1516]
MENMHEEEADNQVRSWAASSWPDFSQLSDNCATCGLEPGDGVRFLTCASCLTPRYCSKQCQADGWKQSKHGHKFSCAAKLGLPTPATVAQAPMSAVLQVLKEYRWSAEVRVACLLRVDALAADQSALQTPGLAEAMAAALSYDCGHGAGRPDWQRRCGMLASRLCCEALGKMAAAGPVAFGRVLGAGAVPALVKTATACLGHRDRAALHTALAGLSNVSMEDDGEECVRAEGGMQLAKRAMAAFPRNSQIQSVCCALLRNLVAPDDALVIEVMDADAIDLVANAYRAFPRVCAGDVLRNLLLARPKDEAVAAKCLSVCVQLGFVRVCDGKLEAVPA